MGMLAAVKAYRALSPQQKQLLKAKKITGDYSPDYWIRLLGGLSEFDAQSDQLRKLGGRVFFVALIPVGVGLAFFPVLPFGLLLMAIGGAVWLVTRHMDLSNHLRLVVLPLTNLLGDDVKKGRTLQMQLDLSEGMHKDKRTQELPPYGKGAYHKIVETHYENPWLQWDAVLADGAHLQLQIHDSIRKLKKSKRTIRGKHKTKTKLKVRSRVEVRLKLPVDRYRVRQLPDDKQQRIQVKARSGEKWLGLHARRIIPGAQTEALALEPVLNLVSILYQGIESIPAAETSHA